jgi:hypothetical protein
MLNKQSLARRWLVLAVTALACSSAWCAIAPAGLLSPLTAQSQSVAYPLSAVNVSSSTGSSRAPALAVMGNSVHIAWEEGSRVYHRALIGGLWYAGRSVATGEQPSIVVDPWGVAHLVLVNEFAANYEIYYCRWNGSAWSLPRNVSNTSGVSSAPNIALAPDGMLHVVWADNTPGYSIIYHGYWNGTYWLNEPVPHATGGAPAVAISSGGVLHVVWQDRDRTDAPYEVYHSQLADGVWSLPENLSDTADAPSAIANLATDKDDRTHVTWQERVGTRNTIYYTYGWVGYWSIPERISDEGADAFVPSETVGPGAAVYVGWDESTQAVYRQRDGEHGAWSRPSTVQQNPSGVTDLVLAMDSQGQFHAVWSNRITADNWDVYYQRLSSRLVLPVLLKGP